MYFHPASTADIQDIIAYYTALSPETRSRFAPHGFDEATLRLLLDPESKHQLLLAREHDNGPVVAYAVSRFFYESYETIRFQRYGWAPDDATDVIYAPSVADGLQGRGIGSQMLAEFTKLWKSMSRSRIILWGGVQASNERARAFYRKHGFQELGGFEWNGWNIDMGRRAIPDSSLPVEKPFIF